MNVYHISEKDFTLNECKASVRLCPYKNHFESKDDGELFLNTRIFSSKDTLYKYPRTPHLPGSTTLDDLDKTISKEECSFIY